MTLQGNNPTSSVGASSSNALTNQEPRRLRSNSKKSIESQLATAQVAIVSALSDAELLNALTPFGYNADRLLQGQELYQYVEALQQQQQVHYGNLYAANDAYTTAREQAYDTYMRHVVVARVAFKADRGITQKLGLASSRKSTQAGLLLQARQFYTNALSDEMIASRLNEYGLSREKLGAGKQQVDSVDARNVERYQYKGAAQHATRLRDDALAKLNSWMQDFRKIAQVAQKSQPQLLEKLGLSRRI